MSEAEISGKRKKRGVVRASTTRLKTKVRELEGTIDHPDTPSHARRISQKLDTLSSEFMDVHYNLVELRWPKATFTFTVLIHVHCSHSRSLFSFTFTVLIHVHCSHSRSLFSFTFQYILFSSVLALDIGVLFSHSYSVENYYYNHGIPS